MLQIANFKYELMYLYLVCKRIFVQYRVLCSSIKRSTNKSSSWLSLAPVYDFSDITGKMSFEYLLYRHLKRLIQFIR